MEKGSESMRDRLLARLPQPENAAAYREETISFLAKYERALFWEKWSFRTLLFCAFVLVIMAGSSWSESFDPRLSGGFYRLAGLMFIGAVSTGLQFYLDRIKIDILKEVKQVQLQILELQASIRKEGER